MPEATPLPKPAAAPAAGLRRAAIAAALAALVVLAYEVSYIHPLQGLNITPWNPPAAVAVMLLVWWPGGWWLAWAALLAADLLVRGPSPTPGIEAITAAALVASHAAAALAVRRTLGRPPDIANRLGLLVLLAIVAGGALLAALAYVGVHWLLAVAPPAPPAGALVRYWIGDAVGMLVTLPLLFVIAHPQRRRALAAMLRQAEWWLVAALALAAAFVVFSGTSGHAFKYFYLFFVPMVWAAGRFGLPGAAATAALVQGLLVAGLQAAETADLAVFELQLLMAALAGTGLMLGATVDEREAAAQSLAASLRLAAAGESAAALAHEMNQPLAALGAYARASQLLAQRLAPAAEGPALVDVTGKLLAEAQRAGDVVRRLRDFVQDRAMQLRRATIVPLVGRVLDAQRERAALHGVVLVAEPAAGLPEVWIDELQIEVVLRNLVVNAIEAAAAAPAPREVRVVLRAEGEELRLVVRDSGPGIDAPRLPGLFAPQRSDKPGGMGIGLSLSRAIVEAHDGRLWAEPGPGGRFVVALPAAAEPADG